MVILYRDGDKAIRIYVIGSPGKRSAALGVFQCHSLM